MAVIFDIYNIITAAFFLWVIILIIAAILLVTLLCFAIYMVYRFTIIPAEDYDFDIANKKDLFKLIIKVLLIFFGVISLLFLRIFRIGYWIDLNYYKEFLEIIYHSKSDIPVLVWLYLLIIMFLLAILIFFCFLFIKYKTKVIFITLHIYLLQYSYYNREICDRFAMFWSSYFLFFSKILKRLFHRSMGRIGLSMYYFTIFLENLIFRYLILYLYLLDILTNFGVISTIFYVLPYYFLYSILRVFLMTWYTWICDVAYIDLSIKIYKNPIRLIYAK